MYNATNAFIIISSSSNIRHELGLDRPVPVSSTFNQIQFMISIKLLHVSAPGCHPQGVFLNKGIQVLKLWDFDTCHCLYFINLLTPNDDYSGRTAPLTSKCCILYTGCAKIKKNSSGAKRLIINYGITINSISTLMCTVWRVDKYKITFKLVINHWTNEIL